MKTIPFNLNENVRVKLTPYGHKVLLDNYLKLMVIYPEKERPFPYRAPKEDDEGWSTWQMWVLMRELGEHMGMTKSPFETNILIEIDE